MFLQTMQQPKLNHILEMPVVDLTRLHFNILDYRNLINAVPFFRAICHWLFVRVQIRLGDRLSMPTEDIPEEEITKLVVD